jgi:hypothetical protein
VLAAVVDSVVTKELSVIATLAVPTTEGSLPKMVLDQIDPQGLRGLTMDAAVVVEETVTLIVTAELLEVNPRNKLVTDGEPTKGEPNLLMNKLAKPLQAQSKRKH